MFTRIAEMKPLHLVVGEPQMSWAGFTTAVLVPVLFIGFAGIGVVAEGSLEAADQILPTLLTRIGLSPFALGVVAAGTLAAAMSSSDTITHGAASVYTMDFHRKVVNRRLTDRGGVVVTRIAVVVFCAVAYYIAVFGAQSLVALLLGAYGSIVQFLPLVAATFFWPRATRQGAVAGLVAGVLVNYYFQLVAPTPLDVHPGIWGLVVNTVVLVVVSLGTRPHDVEHVRRFVVQAREPVD